MEAQVTARKASAPRSKRAPRPPASLERVLAYRHPPVLERFRKDYPVTPKAADAIWLDTLRWLWLCGTTDKSVMLAVTGSMIVIDEMWHAFIVFTPEYSSFCQDNFGLYVHHSPASHAEIRRRSADVRSGRGGVVEAFEKQRRAQFELVAEKLGVDTLKRWQVDYAAKYSPAVLQGLRRRALGA
jgi:hypothetical protein